MKLLHFLKNYINSNNSLIYNEDFFENQKNDSENSVKTDEKSKEYAVLQRTSAQEKKSNNKRGFLRAFKQSQNKETKPVENNTIKLIRNTFAQPAFSARPFENKRIRFIETGRSMVEILGVMAVIGVLTVGGISGYRFAMDKYRANDIANEVNLRNRDTWNMYQTKDLPTDSDATDTDELEEWANSTQTGFPIHVFVRSELVFDVQVYDVPPRVCKNVLQMSLQGPMFIWTTIGDDIDTHHLYNGANPEVCDINDEGDVSMVFTTSLETFNGEAGLRNPEHHGCLDDEDCAGLCSDCENFLCESRCNENQVCNPETDECVECVTMADCAENQICNENNRCDDAKLKCDPGTFRTKNGLCVDCGFEADVRIAPKVIMFSDTDDGETQCNKCGDVRKGVMGTDPENTFCAYTCMKGYSYPDIDGKTCHSCSDEETHETKSIEHCLACTSPQHEVVDPQYEFPLCYVPKTCELGTEIYSSRNHTDCVPCGTVTGIYGCSSPTCTLTSTENTYETYKNRVKELCDACPNMEMVGGICFESCPQDNTGCGSDAEGKIDWKTCQRNFKSLYLWTYRCHPCNYSDTDVEIEDNEQIKKLCTDCGREIKEINGTLYCQKPREDPCKEGYYLNVTGTCTKCLYQWGEHGIEATEGNLDNLSKCESNCRINESGKYDANETPKMFVMKQDKAYYKGTEKGTGTGYVCAKKCAQGEFLNDDGWCHSCTSTNVYKVGHTDAYNSCLNDCKDEKGENLRAITSYTWKNIPQCGLKTCPSETVTGVKMYTDTEGVCKKCDGADSTGASKAECDKCDGMRIYLAKHSGSGSDLCVLIDPGEVGICNDVKNGDYNGTPHPAYTPNLEAGEKKKFRGHGGKCYDCDYEDRVQTSRFDGEAQCISCGNRHIDGRDCVKGFCESGKDFITTNFTCQSCNISKAVEIPSSEGARDNCIDCTLSGVKNNVVMTLGDKTYCAPKCTEGTHFRKSDGRCVGCLDVEDNEPEIGSDTDSDNLCRKCGGRPTEEDGHWFCKKR